MDEQKKAVYAKSEAYAEKALNTLPEGVVYTTVLVAKHLKNGAFWGFTDVRDVQEHAEAIKQDPNITARKIGSKDCIIEINPQYIVQNLMSVGNDIFTKGDMDKMQENMASAVVEFEKFLVNKGINREGFGSTIGIYCINNVTTISYKGVSFPALRLNMEKALHIMSQYGYMVKVGGKFIPAADAVKCGSALWESAKLSPTKTGVFIDIKSGFSSAQLKELKRIMEARYKAKQ